jgi:hypothetical protein
MMAHKISAAAAFMLCEREAFDCAGVTGEVGYGADGQWHAGVLLKLHYCCYLNMVEHGPTRRGVINKLRVKVRGLRRSLGGIK